MVQVPFAAERAGTCCAAVFLRRSDRTSFGGCVAAWRRFQLCATPRNIGPDIRFPPFPDTINSLRRVLLGVFPRPLAGCFDIAIITVSPQSPFMLTVISAPIETFLFGAFPTTSIGREPTGDVAAADMAGR